MIVIRFRRDGSCLDGRAWRACARALDDRPSEADLVGACRAIVNAASSLLINLERLASKDSDPAVVEDSRESIRVVGR